MWPFSSPPSSLNYRKIDDNFVVAGQISPADLPKIAEAGFKTIVCARPDNEEPGQPNFAVIAKAAKEAGLNAVHIPVSGGIGEGQLIVNWEAYPEDVASLVHAHPTQNEALGEAHLALAGKPLHAHN